MSAPAPAAPETEGRPPPLGQQEFARHLERLGPFEAAPTLAVAVSGGADSLALTLLASDWARSRGGEAIGVTVDHQLRSGSGTEAARVGSWLRRRGIHHLTLAWTGDKPRTGVQAAARDARYHLLAEWCRRARILHLLLAHHADDQAETIAHRAARGSGSDGLAGMPRVREIEGLRLLRPLLDLPKERLAATLEAAAQPWLEDPSNRSPRFARTLLRRGPPLGGLAEAGRLQAADRHQDEAARAAWLARHARVDPLGFVLIERQPLLAAGHRLRRRVLRAAIMTAGGRRYPPRSDGLAVVAETLDRLDDGGRTLGGARILVRDGTLVVAREGGAIPDRRQPLAPPLLFDGRFRIETFGGARSELSVGALGGAGWRSRRRLAGEATARRVPGFVGESLPAVFTSEGRLVAVPQLGLFAEGWDRPPAVSVRFRPRHPLAGAPFADSGASPSFESGVR